MVVTMPPEGMPATVNAAISVKKLNKLNFNLQ
jgi:hypothetical protein